MRTLTIYDHERDGDSLLQVCITEPAWAASTICVLRARLRDAEKWCHHCDLDLAQCRELSGCCNRCDHETETVAAIPEHMLLGPNVKL